MDGVLYLGHSTAIQDVVKINITSSTPCLVNSIVKLFLSNLLLILIVFLSCFSSGFLEFHLVYVGIISKDYVIFNVMEDKSKPEERNYT